MATSVLVHGGCHGAWCWELVVPLLEASGHQVIARDLPGSGEDLTPPEEVTQSLCAEYVAGIIREADVPVVLVGHSLGGSVISETAELVPELIAGLIYLSASLVPPRATVFEFAGGDIAHVASATRTSADGLTFDFEPEAAMRLFFNRTDPELATRATARLRPHPVAVGGSPTKVSDERWGRVPRAFIESGDDALLPLSVQPAMHGNIPAARW